MIHPTLRFVLPGDYPQIDALEKRVNLYRPEDQPEVEAMFARARAAENNRAIWSPIPTRPGPSYHAFWVSALPSAAGREGIVEVVGVGPLHPDMLPETTPYAKALRLRQDFLELQHLRVDPDARGHGIGQRLCLVVIDWS